MSTLTPLPKPLPKVGTPPPPPLPLPKGAAPPPPPPLGLHHKVASSTKLRRSPQMVNLYQLLKKKMEVSYLEDVQKHGKSITILQDTINSFQSKDMGNLLKFQKNVESQLENLTDENQVLARFEAFPIKKLESLRTAAGLYSKLDAIFVNPQALGDKSSISPAIKAEVEAVERVKEEEWKKFRSSNVHFGFGIITRIKEAMVDLSSSCMELVLKMFACYRTFRSSLQFVAHGVDEEKGKVVASYFAAADAAEHRRNF
ncbi:hypothetical protein RJ641_021606 [Dillenia turbinata]|uniref:Uncharacterized protein n=1 Tax=Dillenia turbinata TaxID=194707 RepID=A0AAN8UF19_9MAGN